MNNILANFVSSILTNPVTITFILFITVFAVMKVLDNNKLYIHIESKYKDLNSNLDKSEFYIKTKAKYEVYSENHKHSDVNINSFIEEIISNLEYNNKPVLTRINAIKNASSVCILFGVLGTFVGLSTMLLSVDTSDIVNSLPATISSMQTAFLTSIFGIVSSIVLTSVIRSKDCEHTLVSLMIKTENILTSQITDKKSEYTDERIEDVKNTIKHISKSIESIEKFDQISQDLTEFNEEFVAGIRTLQGLLEGSQSSIKTFDQSIRKLDKQFSVLNVKFNKLFDKYDRNDDINKEMLNDLKESSKNISNATKSQYLVHDYIKDINAGFGVYERSTQDMLNKLIKHEDSMNSVQRNLLEEKVNLDTTVNSLALVVEEFSLDIQEKLDKVFDKSFEIQDKFNMALDTSVMEKYDLIDYKEFIAKLINENRLYDLEEIIGSLPEIPKSTDKNDTNDNAQSIVKTEIDAEEEDEVEVNTLAGDDTYDK